MADPSKTARRREEILRLLRDGRLWRAEDLADRTGVSVRTIYRDMDLLSAAGLPVAGARGLGYVATAEIALPPLNLSTLEMEALLTGLQAVAEAGGDLAGPARALADRIGAGPSPARHATNPFDGQVAALPLVAPVRAAIAARQKIACHTRAGDEILRPLRLDYWGQVWTLTAWSDTARDFAEHPLHHLRDVRVLPQLFADDPARSLEAYLARPLR